MRPDSSPLGDVLRAAQQPRRQIGPGRSIGMGWHRTQLEEIGQEMVWHHGGTGGYRSFLGFTADGRFGVVLLGNTAAELDTAGVDLLVELAGGARSAQTE